METIHFPLQLQNFLEKFHPMLTASTIPLTSFQSWSTTIPISLTYTGPEDRGVDAVSFKPLPNSQNVDKYPISVKLFLAVTKPMLCIASKWIFVLSTIPTSCSRLKSLCITLQHHRYVHWLLRSMSLAAKHHF